MNDYTAYYAARDAEKAFCDALAAQFGERGSGAYLNARYSEDKSLYNAATLAAWEAKRAADKALAQ